MRAVLQRVSRASVSVEGAVVGRIDAGWLVLLGVARGDVDADADRLAEKTVNLRAFEDDQGKMNRERGGYRRRRAGRQPVHVARPIAAPVAGRVSPPPLIRPMPNGCIAGSSRPSARAGVQVETGVFRAMMQVELVNDGPVTLLLDSGKLF